MTSGCLSSLLVATGASGGDKGTCTGKIDSLSGVLGLLNAFIGYVSVSGSSKVGIGALNVSVVVVNVTLAVLSSGKGSIFSGCHFPSNTG
jgi:hypothetical protein